MAAPDFSNILASLGNVDAAAAQDNPYAPIKSAGDSFAPILMRDVLNPATESNISPGGSILAGLLTGLVSGTGDELGRNYVSHQHDLAQNALHDVFNGNAGSVFSRPDGMGDSVFSSLQNVQAAKQLQDQADAQRLQDEITLKQTPGAKTPAEPLDKAGQALAIRMGIPADLAAGMSKDDLSFAFEAQKLSDARTNKGDQTFKEFENSDAKKAATRAAILTPGAMADVQGHTPASDIALVQDAATANNLNTPSSRPAAAAQFLNNRDYGSRGIGWVKSHISPLINEVAGTSLDTGMLTDAERESYANLIKQSAAAANEEAAMKAQELGLGGRVAMPAGSSIDIGGAADPSPAAQPVSAPVLRTRKDGIQVKVQQFSDGTWRDAQ